MPYIFIDPVQGSGGNDQWEAFRAPPAANQMIANDPEAITTPRPEVPSTRKVIGDREAESLGLYEQPKQIKTISYKKPDADPWSAFRGAPQPQEPIVPFEQRFFLESEQRPDMQAALNERATQMMQGPQTSPMQSMDISQLNVLPAATQGTSPNVSDYGGRLVSKDVFQSDSGEILYRDPADGQVKPTDSKTQVAIRDPADNTVKIFSRSEDTNEIGATGVARTLAPGLAVGAPSARAVITAASRTRQIPRASEVFSTAKEPYRTFDALAIESPQAGTADTVKRINDAIDKGKQPATFPGSRVIRDTVGELEKEGEYVTVDKLRDLKEKLGSSFKSTDTRERAAAAIASREISNIIKEAAPAASAQLGKADTIFSTAKDLQSLQRAKEIAGLRAGRTGYGGNSVNTMRQEIGKILDRIVKGGHTTLTPGEINALREIDQGNKLTNSLRFVGGLSPSKGGIQMGIGLATGGATAVIGSVANKLATVLTGKQIDLLFEKVAKRSPEYAKAVSKAVDRWERTQAELGVNPTPAKLAAYVSASRALASGLTRDGIKITSADLIKALPAPMKSAAEDEQGSQPTGPGVNTR